ncbi:MAG TPA: hypothetical protein VKB38_02365 [Terracidiphilus sp.]|nr:hypothetical protein [Terracidiphilus sp.]
MRVVLSTPFKSLIRALLITVFLTTIAGKATAQDPDAQVKARAELSAGVIAFVNDNLAGYTAATQLASRKAPPPEVPVPPIVDYPCVACADSLQTTGAEQLTTQTSEAVAQVNKWIHDSMEPEATQIAELQKIAHQLTLMGCENGCGNSEELSADAAKALKKFGTVDDINDNVRKLANRVWTGKVQPMYSLYHKDPKRAYAGVSLILTVARDAAMGAGIDGALETAGREMDDWLQTVLNRTEHDAVNGHLYNLCPAYLAILVKMGVIGNAGTFGEGFQDWSDKVGAIQQKLDKLLFFDVFVKLHAVGRTPEGGNMDITWMGKAKMRIDIERDHVTSDGRRIFSPCFKPEFLDGGKMRVNVADFTMNGPQGGVQLISPHSFDAVLTNPQLNLCDPHPVFQVALAGMKYPQEVIQAPGAPPAKANLLSSFMGMVSTTNEIDRKGTDALTGNANHLAPDQKANDQAVNGARQRMNSAKDEIEAHKGDVAWIMSAEGQAAIARVQAEAMGIVQPKLAAAGFDLPSVNNAGQLGMSLASAHLQWTNGQTTPVFQTLKVQKNGMDFELTVSVENTPLQ